MKTLHFLLYCKLYISICESKIHEGSLFYKGSLLQEGIFLHKETIARVKQLLSYFFYEL